MSEYNHNDTFYRKLKSIDILSERLKLAVIELLETVVTSYTKLKAEIANGLTKIKLVNTIITK